MILDALRKFTSKESSQVTEAIVLAWIEVGKVSQHEDLQLVLVQLCSFLSSQNAFIRSVTVLELQALALHRQITLSNLFLPYMRTISVQVSQLSLSRPQFVATFCNLLQITDGDFLSKNQTFLLPNAVLTKNVNLIGQISRATQRTIKKLLMDNMHHILAALLTIGGSKEELIVHLVAVDPLFESVILDDLIRADPIMLSVELLQLYADGKDLTNDAILPALTLVAYISCKMPASTRKTPKDAVQENLSVFFRRHILGIVGNFSEYINGNRGKSGISERLRYIIGLGQTILIAGIAIESAVPQVSCNDIWFVI